MGMAMHRYSDHQLLAALCTSCLVLLHKQLQTIIDALNACLIVYYCRHGLGTTAEGRPFKQYPDHVIYLFILFIIFFIL
jgi:hypothetical protein